MEYEVVYLKMLSPLFEAVRTCSSVKNAQRIEKTESIPFSIFIPEFGLMWPVDEDYYSLIREGRAEERNNYFVFLVVDKKTWFLQKIKYG